MTSITWEHINAAMQWIERNSQEEYLRQSTREDASQDELTTVPYIHQLLGLDVDNDEFREHIYGAVATSFASRGLLLLIAGTEIMSAFMWGLEVGLAVNKLEQEREASN